MITSGRERVERVVLARYMRILSPTFVEWFPSIINIHHFRPCPPSSAPSPTARPMNGVKVIGADRPLRDLRSSTRA